MKYNNFLSNTPTDRERGADDAPPAQCVRAAILRLVRDAQQSLADHGVLRRGLAQGAARPGRPSARDQRQTLRHRSAACTQSTHYFILTLLLYIKILKY